MLLGTVGSVVGSLPVNCTEISGGRGDFQVINCVPGLVKSLILTCHVFEVWKLPRSHFKASCYKFLKQKDQAGDSLTVRFGDSGYPLQSASAVYKPKEVPSFVRGFLILHKLFKFIMPSF